MIDADRRLDHMHRKTAGGLCCLIEEECGEDHMHGRQARQAGTDEPA